MQRVLAAAATLPAGIPLAGWAAALLLGVRDLDGITSTGRLAPVPAVVPPPTSLWRRTGLLHLRSALDEEDVVQVHGQLVTSAVRTAFDLARLGPLDEAVVALDALSRHLGTDMAAVRDYTSARTGWRGVGVARAALALTEPGTRSRQESRLRMLWMLEARLPRPLVNPTILGPASEVLAEADLLDVEAGVVGEYDGAQHRDAEQHADDNAREEFLEAAGLVVVRASSPDMRAKRLRTVQRLQIAYARGSNRDRRADQWSYRPASRA